MDRTGRDDGIVERGLHVDPPPFHDQLEGGRMRFDHLMHWVPDLGAGIEAYRALGFPVTPGGEHPNVGTHNASWRHDLVYVELIAVRDWDAYRAARPAAADATAAVLASGGGALRFAVEVDDLEATVLRVRAAGLQITDPRAGSIRLPSGASAGWITAAVLGPPWAPFFIRYGLTPDERRASFEARGPGAAPWAVAGL